MTMVQRIEDSIEHMTEAADDFRYEIKFQNKAVEGLFNLKELGKCLNTPNLLIQDKLCTLQQMTKGQIGDLSK